SLADAHDQDRHPDPRRATRRRLAEADAWPGQPVDRVLSWPAPELSGRCFGSSPFRGSAVSDVDAGAGGRLAGRVAARYAGRNQSQCPPSPRPARSSSRDVRRGSDGTPAIAAGARATLECQGRRQARPAAVRCPDPRYLRALPGDRRTDRGATPALGLRYALRLGVASQSLAPRRSTSNHRVITGKSVPFRLRAIASMYSPPIAS